MKRNSNLGKLWINPAYDRSLGFTIGEVRYLVDKRNPGISGYLPDALKEISTPNAPYSLHLGIVQLDIRASDKGPSSVRFAVDGRVVAQDGTVMAAFSASETVSGHGDSTDDCRTAARRVVFGIHKELQ
jgi:hypothetical protein